MAYCRWSSDNWKSDVYVYEGVDNKWHCHVAGSRRLNLDTLPPDPLLSISGNDNAQFLDAYNNHRTILQSLPFEEIKLPHAGSLHSFRKPQYCALFLEDLKELGYHIPDGVIEELMEEQTENNKEES